MAKRSTRQLIKDKVGMISVSLDRIITLTRVLEDLSVGRSEPINAFVTPFVNLIDLAQNAVRHFRQEI